ncbi:MAG TPA: hypothetical protein VFE46_09930 [Pirellulales bacterium]|jgi:hypothetical protein|nr:hypothetical protein [Pirellulales bacterium]
MKLATPTIRGSLMAVAVLLSAGCSDKSPPVNDAKTPSNSGSQQDDATTKNIPSAADSTASNTPAPTSSSQSADNASNSQNSDTPEAAFKRYKTAMASKDYKSAYSQMTPESQDIMLGAMAMTLNMIAAIDQSKEPDIRKIREKYGLKNLDLSTVGPNTDQNAMFKQLIAEVKDKPACLAEIITWIDNNAHDKEQADQAAFGLIGDGELINVKIDGENAAGTVQSKTGGTEKADQVKFKKADGKWLIDVTYLLPAEPPAVK